MLFESGCGSDASQTMLATARMATLAAIGPYRSHCWKRLQQTAGGNGGLMPAGCPADRDTIPPAAAGTYQPGEQ